MFQLPSAFYLVVFFFLCYAIRSPTATGSRKPVVVNAWLPFLGYVFLFAPHLDWLLGICRRIYGDIFTISVNGRHLHILLEPSAGPHIFRDHRTFTFQRIIDTIEIAWFGVPQNLATDPVIRKASLSSFGHHIVTQTGVDEIMARFNTVLQTALMRQLHNVDMDGKLDKDGVVVDMRDFISRIVIESAGKAFWGDTWITDDDLIEDILTWDNHVPSIVKGMPKVFTKRGMMARERVLHRLEMLLEGQLIHASSFVEEVKRVIGLSRASLTYQMHLENGYSLRDAALGMLFLGFSTYVSPLK